VEFDSWKYFCYVPPKRVTLPLLMLFEPPWKIKMADDEILRQFKLKSQNITNLMIPMN
jgi:hypothetical protein